MKKNRFKSGMAVAGMLLLTLVTGCGMEGTASSEPAEKPAAAFVVANTANAKPVDMNAPLIQDTMVNCAESYGYVYVIRVDGEPELQVAEDLDIDQQYKTASKERLKLDARNKATNLLSAMKEIRAVHPEADYYAALNLAASALQSLDDSYTSRTIICCGTGLGTTGDYLNFNNNLLSASPQMIVDELKEREALPNLEGITVYWIGMGQVEAPQEELSLKQMSQLESIWQAVIEAAGGEFRPNEYVAVAGEEAELEELPSVSIVDLPSEQPLVFEPEMCGTEEDLFEQPVILRESQIKFAADQSLYLFPEEAEETLRPIAEYLQQHETVNLLLVGGTAGDETNEATLRLSQERADRVKSTLIELGISSERLKTLGMGAGDPWHISGAGTDGKLASENRKVVLLDMNSQQAKEILNQ